MHLTPKASHTSPFPLSLTLVGENNSPWPGKLEMPGVRCILTYSEKAALYSNNIQFWRRACGGGAAGMEAPQPSLPGRPGTLLPSLLEVSVPPALAGDSLSSSTFSKHSERLLLSVMIPTCCCSFSQRAGPHSETRKCCLAGGQGAGGGTQGCRTPPPRLRSGLGRHLVEGGRPFHSHPWLKYSDNHRKGDSS